MGLKGWGVLAAVVAVAAGGLVLLAPRQDEAGRDDPLRAELCGLAGLYGRFLEGVAAKHEAGGSPETAAPLRRRIAALDGFCGQEGPEDAQSVAPLSYSK